MNLLMNGDFGGDTYSFSEWGHEMTATQVPEGWQFWYRGREPSDGPGLWHRPEARVLRVQEQGKPTPPLYNLFTSYSTHCWVLWQRIAVQPDKPLAFSIGAWPWSSNGNTWPDDDGTGSYWLRVGIGRRGETDPHSPLIEWSHGTSEQVDNPQSGPVWVKSNIEEALYLDAMPDGDHATVFIQGYHEWPMKHGTCLLFRAEAWQDEDSGGEYPDDVAEEVIMLKARMERLEGIINKLGHHPVTSGGVTTDLAVWLDWFRPAEGTP